MKSARGCAGVAILFLCALVASLPLVMSWATRGSTEAGRPKWRVLIYMAADNDLEPAAMANLVEIRESVRESSIPVAIQIDRSARYSRADGDWTGARRFSSERSMLGGGALRRLADLGDLDMASPKTLRSFLGWADELLRADHTLLILWGHGRGDRGLLADEGAGTMMSIEGLASALNGYAVDVLAMDLCSMATLRVVGSTAGRASYLVGSETSRHALGWSAGPILHLLSSSPDIDPKELASWLAGRAGERGGEFTGAAIDLREARTLAAAVDGVLLEVAALHPDDRRRLASQLLELRPMSRAARSIDLGSALDILYTYVPESVDAVSRSYVRAVMRVERSAAFGDATGIAVDREWLFTTSELDDARASRGGPSVQLSPRVKLLQPPKEVE